MGVKFVFIETQRNTFPICSSCVQNKLVNDRICIRLGIVDRKKWGFIKAALKMFDDNDFYLTRFESSP